MVMRLWGYVVQLDGGVLRKDVTLLTKGGGIVNQCNSHCRDETDVNNRIIDAQMRSSCLYMSRLICGRYVWHST